MKKSSKNYLNGFSFVELIVGISISMLLMLSVSIFVQNGIKNLANQKSSLENDVKIKNFTKNIYENLSFIDKSFQVTNLSSGVILKINKNFEKGGFAYIGETTLNDFYCDSGSENESTDHITIRNFIPFEGSGADLFNGTNFNFGGITTSLFSGTINSLTGILIGPTDIAFGLGNNTYVSDTLGHSIYEFDKTKIALTIKKIAGKEVFGDDFIDGSIGTGVFLNSPTGLSFSTIIGIGYLFISDTLNDRILFLNTNNNKIYKLLSREDGIKEPTGIYYNNAEKTLYIANSGKKEILTYSSSGSFVDNTTLSFTPRNNINPVNKLEFEFFYSTGITNPIISSPTNTGSINFIPNIQNEDFLTGSTNKLTYYFVKYNGVSINDTNCTSAPSYTIGTSGDPIYCTQVGTGITSNYQNKTFTGGINYKINVTNIAGTDFSNIGSYYIKLKLLSGSTVEQTYYFSYFSMGDNNIFTKDDNTLKVLTGSLGYPTGLYPNGNNLIYNDFLNRKNNEIDKNGNLISNTNLTNFNFNNLALNKYSDTILFPPIKNYDIKYDFASNILNFYINYYKSFSCYGDEKINSLKEFILKKNLK